MKRVLIFGSRYWDDEEKMTAVLKEKFFDRYDKDDLIFITGGAKGVKGADSMAAKIVQSYGFHCAVVEALWSCFGPSAGPRRNKAMLKLEPETTLAFIKEGLPNKGSNNMIRLARQNNIKTTIIRS